MSVKGWAYIPLVRRDGTVADYAIVDVDDAKEIKGHSWRLWMARGGDRRYCYAARQTRSMGTRQTILMHTQLLRIVNGGRGSERVVGDHLNHNTLDNRRENLRAIPQRGNLQNRTSVRGSSSQYRGVHWDKKKSRWRACARLNGVSFHLGMFSVEEEAATVASNWRKAHMPYSIEMVAASTEVASIRE